MHTCVLAVVCFVKKMFTNSMTILLKFSWIKENAYGTGFSVLFLSDFIKIHDTRVVTHERIDTKFLSNVYIRYTYINEQAKKIGELIKKRIRFVLSASNISFLSCILILQKHNLIFLCFITKIRFK